jgi:hypothetical protein
MLADVIATFDFLASARAGGNRCVSAFSSHPGLRASRIEERELEAGVLNQTSSGGGTATTVPPPTYSSYLRRLEPLNLPCPSALPLSVPSTADFVMANTSVACAAASDISSSAASLRLSMSSHARW